MNRRDFLRASILLMPLSKLNFPLKPMLRETSEKIIVIGAGISGVAAARHLVDAGYEVTILEGRDRIGGRMWTTDALGFPLELGANWIHGIDGNPINEIATQLNLKAVESDSTAMKFYKGAGEELSDDDLKIIEEAYNGINAQMHELIDSADESMTVQDAYEKVMSAANLPEDVRKAVDWLLTSETGMEDGTELSEESLAYWDGDKEFGGIEVILPEGYARIVEFLAKDLDIKLEHVVKSISYDDAGVTVTTENQGEFTADRVVVTLPLGVLKEGKVSFTPALPEEKLGAIQRLSMGVLGKILLKFDEAFWPADPHVIGLIEDDTTKTMEIWNMLPITEQPVLLLLTRGDWARTLEKQPDEEILKTSLEYLRKTFGDVVPESAEMLVARWSTDPFSYGSYSNIPAGATPEDHNLLAEPVADRLYFAGEATNIDYAATVHGAFLSGVREAERIMGKEQSSDSDS